MKNSHSMLSSHFTIYKIFVANCGREEKKPRRVIKQMPGGTIER